MDGTSVDALVIGAGPAGSVAAIELARAGARVALADRCDFPRDKACGDALIPDALSVLGRLSLKETVLGLSRVIGHLRLYSPNADFVTLRGDCACVPRRALDDALRGEAIRAGAVFLPRHRLRETVRECDTVRGATFETASGELMTIRAGVTLLATGAAAESLKACGVCDRTPPSAIAARMYVRGDADFARAFDYLCISYDDEICPGYGWIFPGPDQVFNVGVGYFHDVRRPPPDTNVRRLFHRFVQSFASARELMHHSEQLTPLKGAPLRTGLEGARLAIPGLLVIGEAAGLTYSFTGEGIGKAMESGFIAADVAMQHDCSHSMASPMAVAYCERIREAFTKRFDAYTRAQAWLSNPTLINALVWRGRRSPWVRKQLEGIFQETAEPGALFSVSGALRAMIS